MKCKICKSNRGNTLIHTNKTLIKKCSACKIIFKADENKENDCSRISLIKLWNNSIRREEKKSRFILKETINLINTNSNIVEFNSKFGVLTIKLKQITNNVFSFENNENYALISKEIFNLNPQVDFFASSLKNIDILYAVNNFEKIEQPLLFLSKAYEILNDNGHLIIECYITDEQKITEIPEFEQFWFFYNLNTITKILKENKFSITKLVFEKGKGQKKALLICKKTEVS